MSSPNTNLNFLPHRRERLQPDVAVVIRSRLDYDVEMGFQNARRAAYAANFAIASAEDARTLDVTGQEQAKDVLARMEAPAIEMPSHEASNLASAVVAAELAEGDNLLDLEDESQAIGDVVLDAMETSFLPAQADQN